MYQPEPIRLGIVDDHKIVLDGLHALLNKEQDFRICFMETDPLRVTEQIESQPIDILITDIMMPGLSGLELTKIINLRFPEIRIMALSMNGEAYWLEKFNEEAIIHGYALKNIGKDALLEALYTISRGKHFFSKEVLDAMKRMSEQKKTHEESPVLLTAREKEIIQLIEKEKTNKQIAEELFISERTVETHRKNIFRKTSTNSILGLVKYAYQNGIIPRNNL